jgi:hypothetical protein
MINYKEIGDDETWELFARDYFAELGFVVDVPPGRGADQGRDILISEQLTGRLASAKFTWLVSCKYFSVSDKSAGTGDEQNIIDRMQHHKAQGFIGFYSTLASTPLIDRLKQYRDDAKMDAFEVFDRKKIEASFLREGMSKLALRYFPESYTRMRPLHKILGDYFPLCCEVCGKDVLKESITRPYGAIIVWAYSKGDYRQYSDVFVVCKGYCDDNLEKKLFREGYLTGWDDVGDLTNPILFLKSIMAYTNRLHNKSYIYTEKAHRKTKQIYMALAQRTLRDVTDEDMNRFRDLSILDDI